MLTHTYIVPIPSPLSLFMNAFISPCTFTTLSSWTINNQPTVFKWQSAFWCSWGQASSQRNHFFSLFDGQLGPSDQNRADKGSFACIFMVFCLFFLSVFACMHSDSTSSLKVTHALKKHVHFPISNRPSDLSTDRHAKHEKASKVFLCCIQVCPIRIKESATVPSLRSSFVLCFAVVCAPHAFAFFF